MDKKKYLVYTTYNYKRINEVFCLETCLGTSHFFMQKTSKYPENGEGGKMVKKEEKIFRFSVEEYAKWAEIKSRVSVTDVTKNNAWSIHTTKAGKFRPQAILGNFSSIVNGDREVAFGLTESGYGWAELEDSDGRIQTAVACHTSEGVEFSASEFPAISAKPEIYSKETRKKTVLFLAMLALATKDDIEAGETLSTLINKVRSKDATDLQYILVKLSGNLYYRSLLDNEDPLSLKYNLEEIGYLTEHSRVAPVKECLYGTPQIFEAAGGKGTSAAVAEETEESETAEPEKAVKETKTVAVGKATVNPGDFAISERELSEEEKVLVPVKDNNFIWAKWMLRTIQKVVSNVFEKAFRNVLLIGEAGCGKSKYATQLAMALNRPYQRFTCGPDTTQIDILGSILPRTTGEKMSLDDILVRMGLKPVSAVDKEVEKLQKELEDTKDSSLEKKIEALIKEGEDLTKKGLAEMEKLGKSSDFVFQKSTIIRAIENGWVVEIQEPTVIKRASVLVSLNALLEDDLSEAQMTLANGEVVQRHRDAVVIMTANPDYIGCTPIQQSVLSRMQIVKRLESPDIKAVVNRLAAETGCKDKKALRKVAEVVRDIKTFCSESGITDGIVGMREASAWVKSSMEEETYETGQCKAISDTSLIRAAFDTVLFHASQNEDDIEAVISGPFEKIFNLELVEKLRKEANE